VALLGNLERINHRFCLADGGREMGEVVGQCARRKLVTVATKAEDVRRNQYGKIFATENRALALFLLQHALARARIFRMLEDERHA